MKCNWCHQEMLGPDVNTCFNKTVVYPDGIIRPSIKYDGPNECHDCKIQAGGYHHPGCDVEVCPKCKGQLISCGCLDDDMVTLVMNTHKTTAKLLRVENGEAVVEGFASPEVHYRLSDGRRVVDGKPDAWDFWRLSKESIAQIGRKDE